MQFIIEDICTKIGPRPPCSPEETKCATYLQEELNKYTSIANIEKFKCHPGSYLPQFQIPIFCIVIATLSYWLFLYTYYLIFLIIPLCALFCSLLVIQTNIMRNTEFIDPLFPQKESTNVVGIFKSKGEPRRRIVIGGHHDSNWEYPILNKSWKMLGLLMALPVILSYLLFGIFVIKFVLYFFTSYYLFLYEIDLAILLVLLVLSLILIVWAFNIITKHSVLGANDNLSALAVIFALARHLQNHELKNTEVWLVSHGCEEIGDRGSKRFAKQHHEELKNALVINLDIIGGKNCTLRFVTSEVVFLVKLFSDLVNELSTIAEEFHIPYQKGRVDAFTDSMAYAQNKIRTCSIVAFPQSGIPPYYHTRNDTIEHLDFNNLWNCYKILRQFIKKVDTGEIFKQL